MNARAQVVLGGGEGSVKAIACGFDDLPIEAFHGRSHKVVVASQDGLHRLRKLLPKPGAAFQVCKQKGQCRWRGRRRIISCHSFLNLPASLPATHSKPNWVSPA